MEEEYVNGGNNHKRKRVAVSSTAIDPSSSSSSFSGSYIAPRSNAMMTPQVVSFPFLSDEEQTLHTVLMQNNLNDASSFSSSSSSSSSERVAQPSSSSSSLTTFSCVSKFLFSLSDESRDRGSAKLAVVHIQLRHPSFASNSLNFTTSFKVDGRKSFSNAPYKKYYARAIHAAWFASPTSQVSATTPSPNAVESTPTNGRVMLLISQRNGRPNGKGFTGLKHDTCSYSSKHPLLCLSSNSVEYYISVFINQSSEQLDGEFESPPTEDWTEVETEVSARFDAGQVILEPVSIPSSSSSVMVPAKKQRIAVLPVVPAASSSSAVAAAASVISSMRSIATVVAADSSSSPSSSPPMSRSSSSSAAEVDSMMYSADDTPRELASPVPTGSMDDEQSSMDSPFTDPTEYDSCCGASSSATPLHHEDVFAAVSASSGANGNELDEPQFHLADDELIGASSSSSAEHWCPMASEEEEEILTPAAGSLMRHTSTTSEAMFSFEQQQHWKTECASFPVNPFSEESVAAAPATAPKRPRLVIHMDPGFEHGLLPLLDDMSWASNCASFPAYPTAASPLPSPQPTTTEQINTLPSLAY